MPTTTTPAAALAARDRIARRYLREADELARSMARRLRGLADPDDLQQEARLALVQAAARVQPGTDPLPYLRRTIAGTLRRYVRDRVRLVRVPRRAHEAGGVPLSHASLDAPVCPGGPCPLDTLATPEPERTTPRDRLAREVLRLVEQLPAGDAAALRLTVLEGLSLREDAAVLEVGHVTIKRRRVRAVDSIRYAMGA
ncbi:MAG: sigma-70 family RNA polymerase sigma factor [Synechococcus sp.]|nr:sigma-70 family RNA polymerase sigma factor [Synechococcus sp.]